MRTLDDLNREFERDQRARTFTVAAMAKAVGRGFVADTIAELDRRLGPNSPYAAAYRKSAVAPIATTAGELQPFGAAFLRLTTGRSAFEALGLPKVPPYTRIALANGPELTAGFVPEHTAIPVGTVPLDFATLTPQKVALIVPLTAELVNSTAAEAVGTVERLLTQVVSSATDTAAFDPTVTGSLTDGAIAVTATGTVGADVELVLAAVSGGVASRPALVLGAAAARRLLFSGNQAFNAVALAGAGQIGGVPAFTSPSPAIRNLVIAIDRDGVLVADGGIDIAASGQATLQLDDLADGSPSASTVTQSVWQQDLIALRALRFLAWVRRDDAVAYLTLATGSPA